MKNSETTLKTFFGINEIIEMKNKSTGIPFKFVKVLVESEDRKKQLLNERFIKIGLSKLYLEDFIKPPTQCRKCKSFGHNEKNCQSVQKCGKCTGNHVEDQCGVKKENYKCANCGRSHSSFYRGCHDFREAKNQLLLKNDKISTVNSNNNSGKSSNTLQNSTRISPGRQYSSVLATNNNDELLKQFEIMLTNNKDQIIKQTTDVVKQESVAIQKRIDKIMQQNNLKLCYFVVDTIKALVPAVRFTTSKMKIIQEAFISHQLGDIQIDNLKNYYCRNETGNSETGQSGENEYRPFNNFTSN
jgi:hypothetical protein